MQNTNHIVYDIKLSGKIKLQDLENLFDNIVELIKVRVLKRENYVFENGGITLFYLLAESHISAHYRIEDDYLALDIYSCNNFKNINIQQKIYKNLPIKTIKTKYFERNVL